MATRTFIGSSRPVASNRGSWLDSLPSQKLFSHLREKCSGSTESSGNTMCTIKENLFIWSQEELALLTINMKRLYANPNKDIFQTLLCALPDFFGLNNCLLNLIPEESGRYIALHCKRGVAVIKLHYHRGDHGEFSGGGESVLCRTVQVASDLFTVNDRLSLMQVSWYPQSPDTLILLTSDNLIRLFHLAEPNLPVLQLPLFSSSPSTIHFYPSTIKLDEYYIVAFSLWKDSAFVFHDSGDVSLVSLSQDSKPQQLSMHPQDTIGNYINSSCSMLCLDTNPLALVLAGRSEMDHMMVCHCLYLDDMNREGQDVEGTSFRESERLYVVESIHIETSQPDKVSEGGFTLLPDPANPHGYFVRHPEGVHSVHMPWLKKLERFAETDMSSLVSQAECQVNYLLGTVPNFTSLQGLSIMWEPRLGYALIGLTSNDLECLTLALDEQTWEWEDRREVGGDDVDWFTPKRLELSAALPQRSSTFVKTIQDILHPSTGDFTPAIKSLRGGGKENDPESQAECLQFLMASIQQLRSAYILRQGQALKEIEKRVSMSARLKEQIFSDLLGLQEGCEDMGVMCDSLRDKVDQLSRKNTFLLQRVKRLACRVESRSPIISEAEECMMKEVEGVENHIKTMAVEVFTDKGKLKLYKEMDSVPSVDLNASQCSTLIKKLTENGKRIKVLTSIVKSLGEVTT